MGINFGEIYFVHEFEKGEKSFTKFVKIGRVNDDSAVKHPGAASWERLKDHQTGNPKRLTLIQDEIVLTDAVSRVEAQLHKRFAIHRVSGEWFNLTDDQVVSAVSLAKELAEDATKFSKAYAKQSGLKESASNGKRKKATSEDLELLELYAISQRQIAKCKELQKLIKASFTKAIEEGIDLRGAATRSEGERKGKLDLDALQSAHPKIFARYLKVTQSISKTTKFQTTTFKETALGDFFDSEWMNIHELILEALADEQPYRLNEPALLLEHLYSFAEWDNKFADAMLRASCGKYDGIDGVLTLMRRETTSTIFDEASFQNDFPDLSTKFRAAGTLVKTLRPRRAQLNR